MCLNHPCYESLNRFAFSKPARIGYCIFLVIVCILICFRLLQASDQLQELKSRDASRLQIIPKSNKGYLIYIESRSQENIESWTRLINNDLEEYKKYNPNRQNCRDAISTPKNKSCDVDLNQFGPCNSDNYFGYHRGTPCIFLKFKKIKDWVPKLFQPDALPTNMPVNLKEIVEKYRDPMVWMSCIGGTPADLENIGPIQFFPQRGFPSYYFPYTNQDGYLEPLVAVHFEKPSHGVVINVECTVWAENLQDTLKFELLID